MPVKIPATGQGDATPTVATDDIAAVSHQLIKIEFGTAGTATPVSSVAPLPTSAKTVLTPAAPAKVAVGVGDGVAVAANAVRTGLVLVNTSAAHISLGLGQAAVLDSGITLMPTGGTWTMDEFTFTTAAIHAIASAGPSNLAVQEFS